MTPSRSAREGLEAIWVSAALGVGDRRRDAISPAPGGKGLSTQTIGESCRPARGESGASESHEAHYAPRP